MKSSQSSIRTPIFYSSVETMIFHMFAVTRKQLQVNNSIVRSFPIFMMVHFFLCKKSFYMTLHHKTMLFNITFLITKWMKRLPYMDITKIINYFASFAVGTTKISTFMRTVKSFTGFYSFKIFSTLTTSVSFIRKKCFTFSLAKNTTMALITKKGLFAIPTFYFIHLISFYKMLIKKSILN